MRMTKPSLTLVRRLKASPARVYAAWTDPAQIARWFGPDNGGTVSAEADVRVGGRYSIVFHTEDGERHNALGEYLEVEPGRKLVMTWEWVTMPERRSQLTIEIRPRDGGAELTLLHEQFFDEAARDAHNEGWTGCLAKLERFLEGA